MYNPAVTIYFSILGGFILRLTKLYVFIYIVYITLYFVESHPVWNLTVSFSWHRGSLPSQLIWETLSIIHHKPHSTRYDTLTNQLWYINWILIPTIIPIFYYAHLSYTTFIYVYRKYNICMILFASQTTCQDGVRTYLLVSLLWFLFLSLLKKEVLSLVAERKFPRGCHLGIKWGRWDESANSKLP